MAEPVGFPNPLTTLITPGGKPASLAKAASLVELRGAFSDDFKTTVFPQISAGATLKANMIIAACDVLGKGQSIYARSAKLTFHGMIKPTTPYGWRTLTFKKFAVFKLDSPKT